MITPSSLRHWCIIIILLLFSDLRFLAASFSWFTEDTYLTMTKINIAWKCKSFWHKLDAILFFQARFFANKWGQSSGKLWPPTYCLAYCVPRAKSLSLSTKSSLLSKTLTPDILPWILRAWCKIIRFPGMALALVVQHLNALHRVVLVIHLEYNRSSSEFF